MALPRGLRALDHRPFRVFFIAQFVALVGSWMQTVSQAWLVLQLTNSPFKLGLLGTLQFGPILLLAPFAGVVADRWPTRRLLIATQAVLACQAWALALLVLTGRTQYWQIALLGMVTGLANTLDPPVRQSFVMSLVGRHDLVNAVALNSASFNTARIQAAAARPARGGSVRRDIAEGIRHMTRTPRMRAILVILFVVSLFVFNFTTYVPLLARTVLHLGPEGFGFLMTALGVGAVSGALAIGARANPEPGVGLLLATATVACTGLMALSTVRHPWAAVPMLFVTGFAGIITVTGTNTSIQLSSPDDMRGRAMSLYTWIYGGVFPLGSFMVGAISERHGVSMAFLVNGSLGVALLLLLAATRPWRATAGAPAPQS
jgi:predicted MFS family arabinose efflux permease